MKKRYCITLIIIGVIILFSIIILSFNNINMNNALELRVPLLAQKEKTKLQNGDFFNEEEVTKIQLSNMQLKKIEKKIQKNEDVLIELEEKIKEHTRENIFYQIPDIKNCYWIFTNRSNGVNDKHSIEELLEDKMYYAISLGVLDIDNKTLYYYEFDR